MTKSLLILLCVLTASVLSAQTNLLTIQDHIRLPKDTLVKNHLLYSLNGFLADIEKPNRENRFVLKQYQPETSVLLDEMKGLTWNKELKDSHFYKYYLGNVSKMNDSTFMVQWTVMGVEKEQPVLKAAFTMLARHSGQFFYFYSPLVWHTANWQTHIIGYFTFRYKSNINLTNAFRFVEMTNAYDKRLNAPDSKTDFYCCDYFGEVLQIVGVDYKSGYNGYSRHALSSDEDGRSISVNGVFSANFNDVDPHDHWHSRLHRVLPADSINRPVDEGTAYLYGGSWGLSWQEILDKFKLFAAANRKADWLRLYNESKNFDENSKYPLNVDFVINALIVQKIEREKGFSAVMELLSCGKKTKDNENYFAALERIAGIKKKDFNKTVRQLIASH